MMVSMAWPTTVMASRVVWLVPIDQAPLSLDLASLISLDLCYWILLCHTNDVRGHS